MFNLPPLFAHIVEIVTLVLLTALSTGCGLGVLRLLRVAVYLSLGERLIFGLALGYGLLGFLMLGMGVLGIILVPVGLMLLFIIGLIGYICLYSEVRCFTLLVQRSIVSLRYPPNLFLAIVIMVSVAAALSKALVPVHTQDDLMYHLALPRRYVEQHAISFHPDSTYSLFPQLMEMLYTWGLLLGSDRLSVLFAFSASLIGPAAAALFAKRYLGGDGSGVWGAMPLLVAALFLSSPLVGYIMRAANTDLAQVSFDFLAVYAFYLAVRGTRLPVSNPGNHDSGAQTSDAHSPIPSLLVLSGLCCGLSFSVKYYGFAVPLALLVALLVVVFVRVRQSGLPLRAYVTSILSFGLPMASLVMPWLLRNYFAAGNPIWPLAGGLFGGSYWSPQASPETLLGRAPGVGPGNIVAGLDYLWDAMTRPPLLIERQLHVVSLGPLLLPALLALPLVRWRPALGWIAYAAVAYWLLWAFFFSHTSARYLSTFFLFVAVLGAYGLVALASRYRLCSWAIGSVVSAILALLTLESAFSTAPYLPAALALDRAAERQFLQSYMEDYPMMEYIRVNTAPSARIYVWDGQPRGYYIPRPYVYARLVPLYTNFAGEPQSWRRRLDEQGITHVLVHERDILAPGQLPGVDPSREAAQLFASRYFGPQLFTVGTYSLYDLLP
jgi:hypothetical protein